MDSRQHRNRFVLLSAVFLALLLGVLVLLNLTADSTSGLKIDLTEDGIYTTSEATKEIFGELKDDVTITYYCSKELPDRLSNLLRDTVVRLKEFERYSRTENDEGETVEHIRSQVVDPEEEAELWATEKTDAYMTVWDPKKAPDAKEYDELEEPEQPRSIMQMFGQQQQRPDSEVRKERESQAAESARARDIPKENAYRDLLFEEYKEQKIQELAQEGVQPVLVQDRVGNAVKQVKVYSSIRITYLDRQPEIIPLHTSLENLEYELAHRILKLTLVTKPIVAIFDPRKPPAPPFNPQQPMPPPQSDFSIVTSFLSDLADVRDISLKDGDAIDDFVKNLKKDELRREREGAGDTKSKDPEDVELEPGDYKRLLRCLVVAQPHGLEERQAYEISRAVSLGIPTVFLVSRYSMDVSREGLQRGWPITPLDSGLDDLFEKWGIEVGPKMLASNDAGVILVPRRIGGIGQILAPMPVSAVVGTESDGIDRNSLLTSGLRRLLFPATTGLDLSQKKLDENELVVEKLVESTEHTWDVTINPFAGANNPFQRGQPPGATLANHADDLAQPKDVDKFKDFVGPSLLAAHVTGKFPFGYEGESVPAWKPPPSEGAADPHGGMPPGFPGGMPGGIPGGIPGGGARDLLPDAEDPLQDDAAQPTGDDATPAPADTAAPKPADDAAPKPIGPAAPPQADDAAVAEEPEKPAEIAHVDVVDGRVVFLASADMLRNDYLQLSQQSPEYRSNAEFFRNVIQIFTLHDKMVQIRRKNLSVREFSENSESWAPWIILANLVLVPVGIGFLGIVRFLWRRQSAVAYERRFIQQS